MNQRFINRSPGEAPKKVSDGEEDFSAYNFANPKTYNIFYYNRWVQVKEGLVKKFFLSKCSLRKKNCVTKCTLQTGLKKSKLFSTPIFLRSLADKYVLVYLKSCENFITLFVRTTGIRVICSIRYTLTFGE